MEKKKENKKEKRELLGVELKVKKELDKFSDETIEEFLKSHWTCGC